MIAARLVAAITLCSSLTAVAADNVGAIHRTNAQNYKDRALAACISAAYPGSPAGEDAGITQSAFLEWTYYDDEPGNAATDQLVKKYLQRDYSNPVEGYAGAKFDLLKCIDMYHSRELDEQVRKYVPHPDWIGDNPNRKKGK
jgi:hypothetical protein